MNNPVPLIPTFSIYTAPGIKRTGLHLSWCEEQSIGPMDRTVRSVSHPNMEFTLHMENSLVRLFSNNAQYVQCIISFQVYTTGEQVAVARVWQSTRGRQYGMSAQQSKQEQQ